MIKFKHCEIWHAMSFKMIPYMLCLDLWLKRKEGTSIEGSEWLIKIKTLLSPNLIHEKR